MKTYPLTQPQIGLFLECMQHPEGTRYNQPFMVELPKSIDLDRMEQALKTIYNHRPELRIRFLINEGNPRQFVDEPGHLQVERLQLTEAACEEYIKNYVTPFDIFKDTLVRFTIVETPKQNRLLCQLHHLVADGLTMAMNLAKTDFPLAYQGQPLEDIPYGMLELAEEEEATFHTPEYKRAKEYYKEQYSGYRMISLSGNGLDIMGEALCCSAYLPMAEVDDWCKEQGVQSNLLLIAAFSQVIATLSREEKIAFTTLSHGRMDRRLRKAYGMFVHTVPIKADVNQQQTVIEFIRSFRRELMSTIRYAVYPFSHFCRDLQMVPGVNFSFQSGSITEVLDFGDQQRPIVHLPKGKTGNDMTVIIYEVDGQYDIRVEASNTLYTKDYLQMVARAVKNCVLNMMAHPDAQLSGISMLSDDEQRQLIGLGTGPHLDVDPNMTWVDAFEQTAARQPDRVAVVDKDGQMTYAELSQRSNALAHTLIAEGVRTDDFVGLMLERVKEFPMAVLGIHKAGAAYAPLDIDYPADRLNYMVENSQAKVLVTTRQTLEDKQSRDGFEPGNAHVIYLDDINLNAVCKPVNRTSPKHLAYMIYTSGSTGKPKGVMLHQAGLWNFTVSTIHINSLTAEDHISCHRSFSFDAHIEDIFPVLVVGASIHIMPSAIRKDLNEIYHFLTDHQITGGGYTTSIAKMLLTNFDLTQRYITCGGEALSGVVSDKVQVINVYGPTECTDHAATYALERGREYGTTPIGRPMPNSYCLIVDRQGRLMPRGVEGELCVGGIQVGRGYWQLPEQTDKAFTAPHPALRGLLPDADGECGVRIYHTGDICRWNDEGLLEYVGRADAQVKLRGYRIEMGEVEDALLRYPGIRMAAAEIKTVNGTQHLCAYYTSDGDIDEGGLRGFLAQSLTSYMVPDAYMQLDDMPRTPSGKVDRRRLPEPVMEQTLENEPATTEKERRLLTIARQLIGRDDFGVTDDLLLLGLTSMTAMKLAVQAGTQGVLVKVADVLKMRTIRQLLSVSMGLGTWQGGYDRRKPVLVVMSGIIDTDVIVAKVKAWQEYFSIFAFERTSEHDKYVFLEADGEEMVALYFEYLKMCLPKDANLHGFVGLSWGGEQAYKLACRWSELTGKKPTVYLGDTRIFQEQTKYSDEQVHEYAVAIKNSDAKYDNAGLETLEREIKTKSEMIARLRIKEWPHYDGKVVLFNALQINPTMDKNIEQWRSVAPRLEVVNIDDHHGNVVDSPEYIDVYTEKMKEKVKE